MTPDAERLDLAKKLIGWLQEDQNNVGFALHQEADRYIADGRFDQAAECCHTTMLQAQRANDGYARGASQFHLGLAYFVLRENEGDRAAKLCGDAARGFHTYSFARGEGVSYFAAAKILEYACNQGKDRWQAAMRDALQALLTLKDIPDLARTSQDHYNRFSKRYSAHLQQPVNEPAGPAGAPAGAANATSTDEAANSNRAAPPPPASGTPGTTRPPAPNGNERGTPAPDAAPPGESPPPSPSRPAARARSRRLSKPPVVRFGSWRRVLVGTAFLAGVLILALAGYGLLTLWLAVPALAVGFAIGVVATIVATLIPFGALYVAQQLYFYGRPTYAAVVTDVTDGRVWTFEDEERHWLLPFRQQLAAWLPLQLRQTPRFREQIAMAQGAPIAAQLIMFYRVVDASLVWDRIAGSLTPTLILGIPLPQSADATGIKMDDYAEGVVAERLVRIARGVIDAAQPPDSPVLEHALLEQLRRDAEMTGLYFKKVSVAPYARLR